MQPSRSYGIIASVITITGVVVIAYLLYPNFSFFDDTNYSDPQAASLAGAGSGSLSLGAYPSTLSIPKISVNAHIQYVGITSTGNMDVPSNYKDVAWYKNGTVPGQPGTAVIDGHLDGNLGAPAVFYDLSKLSNGDVIDVQTKDGSILHFKVTAENTYAYNDPSAPEQIFKQESIPTLRLITCGGRWLTSQRMYDKRLVITAELTN